MKRTKVISLFAGAGGLDIGFENAGFEIAVAIESDPSCCNTLRKNNPKLKVIERCIEDVPSSEIMEVAGLKPLEAALVIGGPPCQPFSLAGNREGLNDPRGKLLLEFIRIIRETLPKGFVLENVKGLLNWDHGHAKEMLLRELEKPICYEGETYQYKVAYDLLNAVSYGVPQMRERVFFVGNRVGLDFTFPEPTHFPSEDTNKGVKKYRTVRDAIGHLPPPEKPSETAMRVSRTIRGRIKKHGY
jgi:DNA (cytosine-5)-methyltransferase 1